MKIKWINYGFNKSYGRVFLITLSFDKVLEEFEEGVLTINATPIIIMAVAIIVVIDIFSLKTAQPRNTAMTGTIYAKEFAMVVDSALRSQKNSAYPTDVHRNIKYK